MGLVSVVIPTFNCVHYLPKAISSVFAQDIEAIEIIIVDDNSNDGTAEYLERESKNHNNIIVITTEGVGVAEARNLAIREAKGEYIAFLDADDYWYPGKIKEQLKLHQGNKSIGMSFTNYDHLNEDYQVIIDCFGYWNLYPYNRLGVFCIENPLNDIFANNFVGTSTVMVNRSVFDCVGLFDSTMSYCEDWQLWLRVCEYFNVAVLTKTYAGYLMRQGSATQSETKRLNNLLSVESVIDNYHQRSTTISSKAFKLAKARVKEGYADYYRAQGEFLKALTYNLQSLIIEPNKRRIKSSLGDIKKLVSFSAF